MDCNKIRFYTLVLCLGIILACNAALASGATNWDNGEIIAEGFGVAPENARNPGQARALARRAAIVDAYRNLGEFTNGVRVDSETLVQDMIVESDVIKTKMSALIRGAVIVSETANPDGSYQVTMKIPLYGKDKSLAHAVLPETPTPNPFPNPFYPASQPDKPEAKPDRLPVIDVVGAYTGLVVDCSGLGLDCVMSPVIFDDTNRPIYGHENLDYDKVIEYGMASYSKDGINNMRRAGAKPLVVKAIRLMGHNANPVVSQQDANRILLESQKSGFLPQCAVVFIR